jgi:hypothetical protein
MNWEAIGAIGEIVGAAGVVLTLVYLANQIRQNTIRLEQNTLTARAAAQNASNEALRENRKAIFQSLDMSEIYMLGNQKPEDLDEVSMLRYRLIMMNVTETMLEIYTQTLLTNFSPETWQTQGTTLVNRVLATPGGKWFWENFADNYAVGFRAEVNRILLQSSSESSNPL